MKALSDAQLFVLIRKDNGMAFQEIYNRYWERLFSTAYRRLQDTQLAEELVQETFVNLYVRKDDVVVAESLAPYLHSVLKNRVIDEIRKQISSKVYKDSLAFQPVFTAIDSHDLLERKEVKEKFAEFSDTLPKKCRQVFLLKQEDLSNKTIAEILHISEKTVEGHVSHARKLLKSYMTEIYLYSLILASVLLATIA